MCIYICFYEEVKQVAVDWKGKKKTHKIVIHLYYLIKTEKKKQNPDCILLRP